MSRLTVGMFNTRSADQVFGLFSGQMRTHRLVKNAGWYNQSGELLGNGDLSMDDLETISLTLEEGEVFVVVREYPAFVTRPSGFDAEQLPLDYLVEHADYVIIPAFIYRSTRSSDACADGIVCMVDSASDGHYVEVTLANDERIRRLLTATV